MKGRSHEILFVLRILGVLLGISFLVFQILSSLRGFNWAVLKPEIFINIILALILILLALMLQMAAWKFVLEGINHSISLRDIFSGFNLSFVARYIPGTIWGYLTRGEWLKREHGISYAITNIGSIFETLGYIVTDLLIVIIGMLLTRNILFIPIFLILFLIGSWASLNLVILWNPTRHLFRLDQNKISRFPLPKWINFFLLCIGMWFCYGIGLTIFVSSISFQVTLLHALEISAIYAFAWLIGFVVPFIPSGLGLREYSLTILLISQFGLLKADASFIAIGFRVLVLIAELLWIAYGLTRRTSLGRIKEK